MEAEFMDDESDAAETLAKQRRFLTITSLIIIAFYLLEVDIKCEADYSGFGIILHSTENAVRGLWIIWTWAVLRYLQRLNALWQVVRCDVLSDVDSEDLRTAYKPARRYLIELCERHAPEVAIHQTHLNPRVVGPVGLTPTTKSHPNVQDPSITKFYKLTSDDGRRYEIEGGYAYRTELGEDGVVGFNPSMIWSKSQTRSHRRRSWFSAVIRLPKLIDHLGPLGIALIALACPLVFPHSAPLRSECDRARAAATVPDRPVTVDAPQGVSLEPPTAHAR
jgi:hypothetical protein